MDVMKLVNWFRVASNAEMRTIDADELTQMKVMKLLYYVQGTCLAVYGHRAFTDDMLAAPSGPVIERVQVRYGQRQRIVGDLSQDVVAQRDAAGIADSSEMGQVLLAVWRTFGDMSTVQLDKQTRQERPWQETPSGQAIDVDHLTTYFKAEVVQL